MQPYQCVSGCFSRSQKPQSDTVTDMATFPSARFIIGTIGACRIGIGVAFAVAPNALSRPPDGPSNAAALMTRSFAIREVVIGLGGLLSVKGPMASPQALRQWAALGLLTDSGDLAAALVSRQNGNEQTTAPIALAAAATASGAAVLLMTRHASS